MFDRTTHPDFGRFLDTLLLRKAYLRPPLFDFHVSCTHKSRLLGREWTTPADDVEFWQRAGYDYVQCNLHVPMDELWERHKTNRGGAASHSSEIGLIESLAHFRSRRWSWQAVAEGDLRPLQPRLDWFAEVARIIPPEMKILLHQADVFTFAWELIGFTPFCLASVEEPEFIREVMGSIAVALLNTTRACVEVIGDKLGAMFYSDDIAYTEGLMLRPDFFAEFLFPTIEDYSRIGAERGAPLIYHTDGRLYDVFDHFARIGVKGVQPLEPKSMDPLQIKRRWPRRFCLMGNVDLDLLSRGTINQVDAHVRERLDVLHFGRHADSPYPGGYMPGVSNTVPYYVSFDNYCRMLQIVHDLDPGGSQLF